MSSNKGTKSATSKPGIDLVKEEAMDTPRVKAESILNQLTSARWHLDRVGGAADESRRNIELARTIYEEVSRMLPTITMDDQQRRRLETDLLELDNRIRAMEASASD